MTVDLRRELLAFERNTWPRLSPDGRLIAFVRHSDEGQDLWLRNRDGLERRLKPHPGELLGDLKWTADGQVLLYRATQRGREAWRLMGIRVDSRESFEVAKLVSEYWLSAATPAAVVYCSRNELHRVDLGQEPRPLAPNPGFHRWLVDGALRPRGGTRFTKEGLLQLVVDEQTVTEIDVEGIVDLSVQGFSRDGKLLYLLTSHGAKTRRLVAIDVATGGGATVFEDPELDVESYPIAGEGVWFDPVTGEPDICSTMGQRLQHYALRPERVEALQRLGATPEHSAAIIDRSADDRTWLIVYVRDDSPIDYHLYDPVTAKSEKLFVNRPELLGHRLPKLSDFHYVSSDGWKLSGYSMRPLDLEPPFPTVILVHGGPAGRDMWRFHADAHYLASLGYLSLHINYRGSKGFGIDFRQAGNGEWGGRMQEDLYDAVAAGVAHGLVDPARVAFMGTSYGGYASLLAACLRPDLVRCAIAISAPCDLEAFVEKPPPYWSALSILLQRQVGRNGLALRSPQHVLDERCAPLLLAHGVRDPRVPAEYMDRFTARVRELDVPLRYLRFEDEGHHVKSNANRATLFAAIEEFLEEHLAVR